MRAFPERMLLCGVILAAGGATAADLSSIEQERVAAPIAGTLYENVCHLKIARHLTGTFDGSAVLYRERYLLTAGHNTYQDRSRIKRIEIRCGIADAATGMPDQVAQAWQALDAPGFDWFGFPERHDFGVIRLDRPIVTKTPITLAEGPIPVGTQVRLAGYPGGTLSNGERLYQAQGTVTGQGTGTVSYGIVTHKANSGGPVWRETTDGAELVAIHIQPSRGRVVDDDFKREVDKLIAQLDERAERRGH